VYTQVIGVFSTDVFGEFDCYSAPVGQRGITISLSVCVCVCLSASMSLEPRDWPSRNVCADPRGRGVAIAGRSLMSMNALLHLWL